MNTTERRSMVDWFAGTIADKICEPRNLDKPCFTKETFHELFQKMMDEVDELLEAKNPDATIAECADVAAFACFIAYNALQKRIRFLDGPQSTE